MFHPKKWKIGPFPGAPSATSSFMLTEARTDWHVGTRSSQIKGNPKGTSVAAWSQMLLVRLLRGVAAPNKNTLSIEPELLAQEARREGDRLQGE
jgi:hypothetical protein